MPTSTAPAAPGRGGAPGRRVMRPVGFFAASVIAGWVGQLTFYEPAQISLVWPLAGVALIWLITASSSSLLLEAGLLAVAVVLSVHFGVGGWDRALVGSATTVLPTLAMVAVLRRAGRWPLGQAPALDSLAQLLPLSVALLVGGVATAALRVTGLGLIEPTGLVNASLTAVRTVAWAFTIGVVALLCIDQRRSRHPRRRETTGRFSRAVWHIEWSLVAALTAGATWQVFTSPEPLPVLFPLFLTVVWGCLRTPIAVAVSISAAIGVAAVAFTLAGNGPFAAVVDPRTGAVLAQGFLACLTLVALTLALALRDRQHALDTLEATAGDAEDRAALLDAVIGNIEEGIMLVQDDGTVALANAASFRLVAATGLSEFQTDQHPSHPDRPANPGGQENAGATQSPGTVYQPGSTTRVLSGPESTSGSEMGPFRLWELDGSPVPHHELPSRRALDGHVDGTRDYGVVRGTEVVRVVETRAVPLPPGARDLPRRAVVTFRDVTTDRAQRNELEAFAGVVAHDLANPLTVVKGWTEALLADAEESDTMPSTHVASIATRVVSASSQMHAFVNDLLAYTVTRNQDLHVADVDVSTVAHEVAQLLQATSDASVDIDPGICVRGDATLIRQLLHNLIGNAIKYVAHDTKPSVRVSATQDAEWVTVVVADNGIGIPPADRSKVFDDFFRVKSQEHNYRGTGLGLAICKRVVTRHGGDIWVSDPPQAHPESGTRIAFMLPAADSTQPAASDDTSGWPTTDPTVRQLGQSRPGLISSPHA